MKYFAKVYTAVALAIILLILLVEPILKGIFKERLDMAEIRKWYKENLKEWYQYWKESVYGTA